VEEEATEEISSALDLPVGTPVQKVVRLRSAAGHPIAKMTNDLPPSLGEFTREDLERTGLHDLMRRRGVRLHSAIQTVGAATPSVPRPACWASWPEPPY
jgi:DNA-binding GntR family transcriptional regulator